MIDTVLPWPIDSGHLDHATPSFWGKDDLVVVLGQHHLANVLSL